MANPTQTPKPHVPDGRCEKPVMRFVEGTRNSACSSCGRVWSHKGIVLADPRSTVVAREQAKSKSKANARVTARVRKAEHQRVEEQKMKFKTMAAVNTFLIKRRDAVTAAFKDNPEIVVDSVEVLRIYLGDDAFRLVAFPILSDGTAKEFEDPGPAPAVPQTEEE